VPAETPLTRPAPVPTVATPVLPLLQAPPVEVVLNVVAEAAQTTAVPVIAAGDGLTVTTNVAMLQPFDKS
jgi:hypothetical protein